MQIAKRLVGMHPDKVLGALQTHIDSGHEKSALQAIPDLQLEHPQFHNELEQHKARLSERLIEGVKVIDRAGAEVFRCVNCGGGLSRQNPESTHVICQYCGCDAEHPAQNIHLERWNKALDLESNFTIGDFFNYERQRWQAIGVQLFSGRLKEYDSEDRKWISSYSKYTTWWMLNHHREIAWLIDDGKRRYWAEKYTPDKPQVPRSGDRNYEYGEWKLEFAAGEFSYQPQSGERHNSAEQVSRMRLPVRSGAGPNDGQRGDEEDDKELYHLSVETRLDAGGKPKEIEFFRSRPISHAKVLAALSKESELSDMQRWRHAITALISAIPVLVVIAMYLNRGGASTSDSVKLVTDSTNVQMQSFKVEEPGTLLELSGRVNAVSNNSWIGVNFSLENSDGEPIYDKYLEYWHESGRDSDGPWTERQLSNTWHIRVDEADTYLASVSVEPGSTSPQANFSLKTTFNRASLTPFIFTGILSFILVILCRSKISSIASVAASIAVKINKRFDPSGKPKRKRDSFSDQHA